MNDGMKGSLPSPYPSVYSPPPTPCVATTSALQEDGDQDSLTVKNGTGQTTDDVDQADPGSDAPAENQAYSRIQTRHLDYDPIK